MSFFNKNYIDKQNYDCRDHQTQAPPALDRTGKVIYQAVQMKTLVKDRVLDEEDDSTENKPCNTGPDSPDPMADPRDI